MDRQTVELVDLDAMQENTPSPSTLFPTNVISALTNIINSQTILTSMVVAAATSGTAMPRVVLA
jgi:hypothetical protein